MSGERYIKQAIIAALCEHPEKEKYLKLAFSEENLQQVTEAIAHPASRLTKEDLFTPDDEGRVIIDTPGFWKNFDRILPVVELSGNRFTFDDFSRQLSAHGSDRTLLESAAESGGLAKIFSVEVWKGNYDEMERLWYKVPLPLRRDLFKSGGLLDTSLKQLVLAAEGRIAPESGLANAGLSVHELQQAFSQKSGFEDVKRRLEQAGDYLRKEYVLLPDATGNTVFFHQAAWDRYEDIVSGFRKHGEKFEVGDFLRKLGFINNVLARAAEKNALDKVFTPGHWEGRLKDMLDLWSHVLDGWKIGAMRVKDFDNAFAEAESMTYATGLDFRSLETKKALLTPLSGADEGAVLPLSLKGFWKNYATVAKSLERAGGRISLSDLRHKSGLMGQSCLISAVKYGHFRDVIDISRKSGEALTVDDFLSKDRHGHSLLNILSERNELAQVFTPDLWVGRVNEMKTLWMQVRNSDRLQVDIQQVEVAVKQATLKMKSGNKFKLK